MFFERNKRVVFVILAGLLCLTAVLSTRNYLCRGLWFDEALTILEFCVPPDSIIGVYKNYTIPNNHILYSILLRLWLDYFAGFFHFSNPILRLPSLIAGIAFLLSSFFLWRKYFSEYSLFIPLIAFAFSPVFAIYATALRGYVFSFLTLSLAISALFSACENRRRAYLLYWIFSLLSVGIMPNNAAALFASSFLPLLTGKLQLSRSYLLKYASVPFLSLLLFYLPIFPRFISVLSIKEGWSSGFSAFSAFYLSSLLLFLVPTAVWIFSFLSERNFDKGRLLAIVIVFFTPAIFFLMRTPSPFPRTFICIFPVWIFVFSHAFNAILKKENLKRWTAKFAASIFLCLTFLCALNSLLQFSFSRQLSSIIFAGQQDDFFHPYFMEENFSPDETVSRLINLTEKKTGVIFADMEADHQSLVFSAKRFGMPDDFIIFNRPRKKVKKFPLEREDIEAFIVAASKEKADEISKSFGLKVVEELQNNSLKQRIFRVRKL